MFMEYSSELLQAAYARPIAEILPKDAWEYCYVHFLRNGRPSRVVGNASIRSSLTG
jgi:hypothetical protein